MHEIARSIVYPSLTSFRVLQNYPILFQPFVTATHFAPPEVSSSKNITVWFGTGHTHFSPTTCKIDIVVKGVSQTQSKVLGRLQTITCMKKYKEAKSLEELRWEDYTAGRKACSAVLCGKPEKTDDEEGLQCAGLKVPICSEGKDDEGGNLLNETVKELDGVVGEKEKLADGELHLAEDEGKGGELLKEKELVEEADGRSDKLAVKELSCADSIDGRRKVLTQTSSLQGCDIGVSLKEIRPVEVRKEDGVDEEKAVGESDQSTSMVTQIVSIRPKLKRRVKIKK